jgi:hypothetical protein
MIAGPSASGDLPSQGKQHPLLNIMIDTPWNVFWYTQGAACPGDGCGSQGGPLRPYDQTWM